jgi:hypothetical protein
MVPIESPLTPIVILHPLLVQVCCLQVQIGLQYIYISGCNLCMPYLLLVLFCCPFHHSHLWGSLFPSYEQLQWCQQYYLRVINIVLAFEVNYKLLTFHTTHNCKIVERFIMSPRYDNLAPIHEAG